MSYFNSLKLTFTIDFYNYRQIFPNCILFTILKLRFNKMDFGIGEHANHR